jgi:hypothetical protein
MASQLKVDTLTGVTTAGSIVVTGEGNSTTTNLQQGLAKAFCRASDAASLTNTFNIASGTDNGTGNYTYTFTNNMSTNKSSGTAVAITNGARMSTYSNVQTSSYDTDTHNESGTDTDASTATNTFGDLA